ncbi:MAG: phosphate-starvation-inducible PsiE family protein [Gammaproteobacteria bacterium]|uniref:Protein PsiE n=1 Tax=Candidatus Thiopontia autotrophica TaxID=2841688 RepID=A0A8J6P2U9_9GAMM|nr:phosphate-starvation-inducible PsiE family protein [Candidatus Thiopontia autotrophica]
MRDRFSGVVKVGDNIVEIFHLLGLFVIGGTIAWSAVTEYISIMNQGYASLSDILLLFIYLELGAMIGVFFRTHRIPVIFLLFITITAMTRYLAIDIKTMGLDHIMVISGSIFVLSVAVLVLQYSSNRYSSQDETGA